jgi:hypothetical protein
MSTGKPASLIPALKIKPAPKINTRLNNSTVGFKTSGSAIRSTFEPYL